jgi:hypothetical protein
MNSTFTTRDIQGGLERLASMAAKKIGFVSQKTAPPVLIASALAASEGAHPARHRSRR